MCICRVSFCLLVPLVLHAIYVLYSAVVCSVKYKVQTGDYTVQYINNAIQQMFYLIDHYISLVKKHYSTTFYHIS